MNSFDLDKAARQAAKTAGYSPKAACDFSGYQTASDIVRQRRLEAKLLEAQFKRQRQESLAWFAGAAVILGLLYGIGHVFISAMPLVKGLF